MIAAAIEILPSVTVRFGLVRLYCFVVNYQNRLMLITAPNNGRVMFSVASVCPWWAGGSHETTTQDAVGESQVTWDPPDLSKLVHFTRMYSVGCVPPSAVASLGIVCPGGGCLPRGLSVRGCLPETPPVNRITDRCKNISFCNYVAHGRDLLRSGQLAFD